MTTLFDKIWQAHTVCEKDGQTLLYIDRQLVHEVTSPQAFDGLRIAGRGVRRLEAQLAVPDHNVSTEPDRLLHLDGPASAGAGAADSDEALSAIQLAALRTNVADFGVPYIPIDDVRQGIVHVIGPELGFTQPGLTMVCGDSHTSTHGAFGALAFGVGTSEVEHVLAAQSLWMVKPRSMRVNVTGQMAPGLSAKDMALAIIGHIGTAGGTGYVIEYAGEAVEALSMEGRMTLCNMTIEAGARAGLVAPDDKTIAYMKNRPFSPKGAHWEQAVSYWRSLKSDDDATFDADITIDAATIAPTLTWGTSPEHTVSIFGRVPDPASFASSAKRESAAGALAYMGLTPGTLMTDIKIDRVFIGSCTNSRIEDLRAAASVIKGMKVASNVKEALIVPGSGLVKAMAEEEGLDKVFTEAGFQWRAPGCSMCLGMNADKAMSGERVASTSNRNFEGRQGPGARTHLMSPVLAAYSAVKGHFAVPEALAHASPANPSEKG